MKPQKGFKAPQIRLAPSERQRLESWSRRRKTAQALATRARIILEAATGATNVAIAEKLGVSRNTVNRFDLAQPGDVVLAIYDPSGRLVRRLADGRHEAMRYALPWDGRDHSGTPVPGGVYFLRLKTDQEQQSRRLIRIR